MPSIRLLLADDHPAIIEGLTAALSRNGMKVVGYVTSGAEVVSRYMKTRPDVLVLDVRFPEGPSGLDVAKELLEVQPQARIVFYSQFGQNEIVRDSYRVGGAAFITKSQPQDVLARAIEEVAAGKTYFLPEIAERLALMGLHGDASPRARLDEREVEIFMQIAKGQTNNEIAERMKLSSKTIGIIGQAIREKLGVDRATEMTLLAVRHGMLDP